MITRGREPRHGLLVPLELRGQRLGVLAVEDVAFPQFLDRYLGLASTVARVCAMAVANARAFEELKAAKDAAAALALENASLLETARHSVLVRDRFLSMASHELRTPLTSLQLQGETMERRMARGDVPSPEEVGRLTSLLLRGVRRLRRLVEDMLDVTRMTTGTLSLCRGSVDLSRLVAAELESRTAELRAGGYTLTSSIEPDVVGCWDPQRLEQVVANLVGNAIRYGRGQPIDVVLTRADGMARLVVQDRGVGIDRCDHARIFRAFERASTATDGQGGLGLGLYIVAQILASHGGSVDLESAPGAGSTFVIQLPLDDLGA
jgi:signal transduction histidine kinase